MSDEIRKRLKKLNRAPLRGRPCSGNHTREFSKDRGGTFRLPDIFRKPPVIKAEGDPFMELGETVNGSVICNHRGSFLLAEREAGDFVSDSEEINSAYVDFLNNRSALCDDESLSKEFQAFLHTDPFRVLYLDIETTGFRGVPLFLVGLIFLESNRLRIRQLFAREYREEAPLLEYLNNFMRGFDCLVTFNGKSFDMPFILERASSNTVHFNWSEQHFDILHEGRRRYRNKLQNCRLQTLEAEICGRRRTGDIPSDQIPEAYHEFVRTGNACRIRNILYHNGLDLITMAEVVLNMLAEEA